MTIELEISTNELIVLWVMASKKSWEMLSNPLNMNPEQQGIEVAKYIKIITGPAEAVFSDKSK